MGYNHPDLLRSNPYYDDFEDTKNFLRILFKPGYAIQSRELAQLQTLLQNQIAKFGTHIFKDGSQVFGGGITLSTANYIKTKVSSLPSGTTLNDLKGKILTQGNNSTNLVRAKIVDILPSVSADPFVIFVIQYLTGNEFQNTTNFIISVENFKTGTVIRHTGAANEKGLCQTLSVETGIFYVDGFFVNSLPQTVTLVRFENGIRRFNDPILTSEGVTNRVGFEVVRTIVTAQEDETLVDPARGFYNYAAPGADRYTINLNLVTQEYDETAVEPGEFVTPDFVELARVVKGTLDYVKKIPTYSELLDTLARRTYDESGNYTVKPFELEIKNHYRDDEYWLFVKVDDVSSVNSMYTGDFVVTLLNGTATKIGIITSIETYQPTSLELNSGVTSELPTHIFKVKREKVSNTFNYPFFTSSDTVYHRSRNNVDTLLGSTKRITVSRDPDGVYSPEEGGTDEKFVLSVKPGKAYVFGYEFETINNTNIILDKQRDDSVFALNDYNLGSNIGNYFVVKANKINNQFSFNNWYSNFNLEEMPYMKFGGRYIRITIPTQDEDTRDHPIKYWSPVSKDQESSFRSVAFITAESALSSESIANHANPTSPSYLNLIDFSGETNDGSFDNGYIRPQNTNRTQSKFIGGRTSFASSEMVNMSTDVELDISRLVFSEPWHGDFQTAYNFASEENGNIGTYTVQSYPVKQIKCLDTANPTAIEVTTGNALRWVPASNTGAFSTSGSTLFVKMDKTVNYVGSTNVTTARFNIEDGVVFTDPATTTNPISYGSSIAYILRDTSIKRIIVRSGQDLGCVSDAACTDEGQGGFYSVGDIVTQNYLKGGIEVQATGEIIAIGGDFTTPNTTIELYIQTSGTSLIYGVNDTTELTEQNITSLGCLVGPCGLYKPRSSITLNNPACGECVRIGFRDTENVGAYTLNGIVFQYNYLALQEVNNIPQYLDSNLVRGRVVGWDQTSKELIVLETQGRFEIPNGTIYQLSSGTSGQIKYGGRGWDKFKTKYQKNTGQTQPQNDIEKVSGIFIDIKTAPTKNFIETSYSVFESVAAGTGEIITQVAVPFVGNYFEGKDFVVGEEVNQTISSSEIARGTVLSWTHRDITNPADRSDTVIVIEPINTINFVVGNPAAVNKPIISLNNNSVFYDVSGTNTTRTKEIIGAGRIRLLRRQEEDAYQAYFFDIKMDFLPDRSRKYNLNEAFTFYYEDNFKNSLISEFEDEDIKLEIAGENNFVFEVHPDYGVDGNYSKVYDTDRNSLVFRLAGSDSSKNVGELDYRIQKQYTLTSNFGTTSLVFNTGSPFVRFIGGESAVDGKVDSNDLIEHYTLILTYDNGNTVIESLSGGSYNVTTNNYSSPNSISSLNIQRRDEEVWNSLGLINASLICNLNVNPSGNTSLIRSKTIKRNTERVTLRKTKSGTWKALLSFADILSIDKITAISSNKDIKNQFDLYDGQTDNLYDLGQVILKSQFLVEGVPDLANYQIDVTYRYFYHTGSGPFTVNSYSGIEYKNIPSYTSSVNGTYYKLDSVIDLRPLKTSTGEIVQDSKWIPAPANSFDVDYEYYLPRAYKLAITRDLKFKVISGVAGFVPELPPDDENSMSIYNIIANAYIFSKNDVTATMINNRRYTMKDIIALDDRIQELEKFSIMSLLEREIENKSIIDPETSIPRVVSSILVDNFSTHERGDTMNEEYNISIDSENNMIRPPFEMDSIVLEESTDQTTSSNVVKTSDNVVMLTYDSVPLITQLSASGTENLNSFNDNAWIGSIKLTPSTDSWFDVTQKPDVRNNQNNSNSGINDIIPSSSNKNNTGIGTDWSFWKRKWFGNKPEAKKPIITRRDYSLGRILIKDAKKFSAETKTSNIVNVGENKIVDKSVIPFIREKTITAVVEGLKPFTIVYVFFDDVNITSQCQLINSVGQTVSGIALRTDSRGSLQFTYKIEKGKFKTGEKLLVVTDSSTNDPSSATTVAEAVYVANGAVSVSTGTNISTRTAIKKPASYDKNISDPVSQTFFVDEREYPEGVFVSSIDLFFATKDQTLPVTLELRPTDTGYPLARDKSTAYPFSVVTKYPSEIVVSSDPNTDKDMIKTTFTFSTPVHLLPGEHSIVLKSNSSEYSIYVAEFGKLLINSESRITSQAALGSFFKSQNAGKWQKYENIDMMFVVNRCNFNVTNGVVTFSNIIDPSYKPIEYQTYTVNNDEIKFVDGSIKYKVRNTLASSTTIESNFTEITPNSNIVSDVSYKVNYGIKTFELQVELTSNSSILSPLFDIDRLSVIGIGNVVENNSDINPTSKTYNFELEPNSDELRARYISKIVQLESGFESTNIKGIFSVNVPADTKIQVFLKHQSAGKDSPFDDERYVELVSNKPNYISPDSETFTDIEYTLPNDLTQPFSKFAIKICMYSSNPARVPKVKEMRVVSVV
jgi:hypothetical protein